MAKAEAASPSDNPASAPDAGTGAGANKSKKKLIIMILAAVHILGGGGAAAWWFLKPAPKKEGEEVHKAATVKADPKKLPIFVPLDTFTVNLADKDYDRFLQIVIQLQVKDEKINGLLKTYDPAIRHRFLFLMSTATSEILKTPEGKQALAQQLTSVANQVLQGAPGTEESPPILGASFTTFVIQ
ncbi:MAG: flagellar basal body-associated FliL family protein [bacterium]|jgi:flagellar FliL protein